MKHSIKAKVAAIAVAVVSAVSVFAPGVASAGQAYGLTYNAQQAFKVSQQNVSGTGVFTGTTSKAFLTAQVRILKDGVQAGSISSYNLAGGTHYNNYLTATYPCQGIGVYHTFVTQARIYDRQLGVASAWDSAGGKNLLCQ